MSKIFEQYLEENNYTVKDFAQFNLWVRKEKFDPKNFEKNWKPKIQERGDWEKYQEWKKSYKGGK